MAEVETNVFPIEALRDFSKRMFLHCGVPKEDAAQAAEVLASADLRGIDSHGVARLGNSKAQRRPRNRPFFWSHAN